MTKTSMNADQATTLSENELFENFVNSDMRLASIPNFITGFDTAGLDGVCERLIEECCDEHMTADPTGNLALALDEFRALCHNFEVMLVAFEVFKEGHLIHTDGEDARYHVPSFNEEAA